MFFLLSQRPLDHFLTVGLVFPISTFWLEYLDLAGRRVQLLRWPRFPVGICFNDNAKRHTLLPSMLLGSELRADAVESYKDACLFGGIPKELTEVDLVRCVDHIIHSV